MRHFTFMHAYDGVCCHEPVDPQNKPTLPKTSVMARDSRGLKKAPPLLLFELFPL